MQNKELSLYREAVKNKIKILTENSDLLKFEKASNTIDNSKLLKCKNVEKVFNFLDNKKIEITGYKMLKCGYIFPHSHDYEEKIIVISGSYYDELSKKQYSESDVQIIEVGELHSIISDNCFFISICDKK